MADVLEAFLAPLHKVQKVRLMEPDLEFGFLHTFELRLRERFNLALMKEINDFGVGG